MMHMLAIVSSSEPAYHIAVKGWIYLPFLGKAILRLWILLWETLLMRLVLAFTFPAFQFIFLAPLKGALDPNDMRTSEAYTFLTRSLVVLRCWSSSEERHLYVIHIII